MQLNFQPKIDRRTYCHKKSPTWTVILLTTVLVFISSSSVYGQHELNEAYDQLADARLKIEQLDADAINDISAVIIKAREHQDTHLEFEALVQMGYYWASRQNFETAEQYLISAELLLKNKLNNTQQSRLNLAYGEIYRGQKNYLMALYKLMRSFSACRPLHYDRMCLRIRDRLASVYLEFNTIPSNKHFALWHATGVYKHSKEQGFRDLEISGLIHMGAALRNIGMETQDRDTLQISLNTLQEAKHRMTEKESKYYTNMLFNNLIRGYVALDMVDSAIIVGEEGITLLRLQGYKDAHTSTYKLMRSLYLKKNNFKKAYEYSELISKQNAALAESRRKALTAHYQTKLKSAKIKRQYLENEKLYEIVIGVSSLILICLLLYLIAILFKNNALKRLNKVISDQNSRLEKMEETRSRFHSILAHDLRGPIGNFKAGLNLLLQGKEMLDKEERQELLFNLSESSERVHSLLENLLAWSSNHNEGIEMVHDDLNLHSIVRQTFELYKTSAFVKKIRFENHVPQDLMVYCDERSLFLVLRNLVQNALKYSNKGGVISVHGTVQENRCFVSVRDTGEGMSPDVVKQLSEEGNTVSAVGTNNERGTGIGLGLVRKFVKINNGELHIESELGEGSTFTVTLPVSKVQ